MYDKSQAKPKRLFDSDKEELWRQGVKTLRTARADTPKKASKFKGGGYVKGGKK